MRNKKWISLAVAVVLTVTALPATVFAARDGESKEELTKAVSPYYREKTEDDGQDSSHFGIGLSISALLCKKHGGELELANSIHGGAIVCAVFSCM